MSSGEIEELNNFIKREYTNYTGDFISSYINEYKTKDDNLIASPLSLIYNLGMLVNVSSNKFKENILNYFNLSKDKFDKYLNEIYNLFLKNLYNSNNQLLTKSYISNSIWLEQSYEYNDEILKDLATIYYAYSYKVNNIDNVDKTNQLVNKFIKDQTNNLIDVDPQIEKDTIFSLLSILYLKDLWNSYGIDLSYSDKLFTFKNKDNSEKRINLLVGSYNPGKIYETSTYEMFYTSSNKYQIKFILPKENYDIESIFNESVIKEVSLFNDYITYDENLDVFYASRILLPAFEVSNTNQIEKLLKNIGLYSATIVDTHEFVLNSTILNNIRTIQSSKLKVDKIGIEGASVTITNIDATSPEPYETIYDELIINRPFGFIIQDNNGLVVFGGIINNI
ncbi:MAG: serpin family protein [Candidatus Onthovivens sp.]|nr:serpin family protein [Candidatus Onthovivens sp.]